MALTRDREVVWGLSLIEMALGWRAALGEPLDEGESSFGQLALDAQHQNCRGEEALSLEKESILRSVVFADKVWFGLYYHTVCSHPDCLLTNGGGGKEGEIGGIDGACGSAIPQQALPWKDWGGVPSPRVYFGHATLATSQGPRLRGGATAVLRRFTRRALRGHPDPYILWSQDSESMRLAPGRGITGPEASPGGGEEGVGSGLASVGNDLLSLYGMLYTETIYLFHGDEGESAGLAAL